MAKENNKIPSEGVDGVLDSLKGILAVCAIAGIGISAAYSAGRTVSNKVLREVGKERRKGEKERRRESRERKKEKKLRDKLELLRAKHGLN